MLRRGVKGRLAVRGIMGLECWDSDSLACKCTVFLVVDRGLLERGGIKFV
jgi:hypothetical protein